MEKECKKMKKFLYLAVFIFLSSMVFAQQDNCAQIINQGIAYPGKRPPSPFPPNILRTGWRYTTGNLAINLLADRGGHLVDEVNLIYSYSSMEQARPVLKEYINENIKIKILQDNKEIIPILVHREFGGDIPSYIIKNKEFSIVLPDMGNVFISASTRGFFWNPLTDESMLDFQFINYPYFFEGVSCFASKKNFVGHDTVYDNQLYVGYAFDGYQWYKSGEVAQIKELNIYSDTAKEYAIDAGQDNFYIVFWINKNKDNYLDEGEIIIIEIQIRGKGTLLK
jgi:hypothetical protein